MSTSPSALYPSDPNAPQPVQPKSGFRSILKNSILPAVSQAGNALGTLYGSPAVRQGTQALHEQGIQQQELNRQRAFDIPALAQAHVQSQLAEGALPDQLATFHANAAKAAKEAAMTPGTPEDLTRNIQAEEKGKASFNPITAIVNGQPTMGTVTGPGEITPMHAAATSPAQPNTSGGAPGWSLNGGTPPSPIANAASPSPSEPPSVLPLTKLSPGPWDYDAQGKPFQHMYDQFGREANPRYGQTPGMMNKQLPPVQLMPYFKAAGINPATATPEQNRSVLAAYNQHEAVKMVEQPDGTIIPVTTTASQHGVVSPNSSGSSTKQGSSVKAGNPLNGPNGQPLQGKTAPANVRTSFDTFNSSQERYNVMQDSLGKALAGIQSGHRDQQAELNLLANHIGMTMGLQKGARINQAIYSEAQHSAPWLAQIQTKWDNDGYLSGVTLTQDQMHQMVDLASVRLEQDRQAYQREIQAAKSNYGMSNNPPSGNNNPAGGGKKNDPLGIR